MQALTFLEVVGKIPSKIARYYDEEANERKEEIIIKYNLTWLKDFYSQPFRPELITELFEGFIDFEDKDNTFKLNGIQMNFYEPREIFVIWLSWHNQKEFIIPSTLDRFISDCKEAEIKLTWKPEIAEKYFKEVK